MYTNFYSNVIVRFILAPHFHPAQLDCSPKCFLGPILWFVGYVPNAAIDQVPLSAKKTSCQFTHDLVVVCALPNGAPFAPALTMCDQCCCGFELFKTAWADRSAAHMCTAQQVFIKGFRGSEFGVALLSRTDKAILERVKVFVWVE